MLPAKFASILTGSHIEAQVKRADKGMGPPKPTFPGVHFYGSRTRHIIWSQCLQGRMVSPEPFNWCLQLINYAQQKTDKTAQTHTQMQRSKQSYYRLFCLLHIIEFIQAVIKDWKRRIFSLVLSHIRIPFSVTMLSVLRHVSMGHIGDEWRWTWRRIVQWIAWKYQTNWVDKPATMDFSINDVKWRIIGQSYEINVQNDRWTCRRPFHTTRDDNNFSSSRFIFEPALPRPPRLQPTSVKDSIPTQPYNITNTWKAGEYSSKLLRFC